MDESILGSTFVVIRSRDSRRTNAIFRSLKLRLSGVLTSKRKEVYVYQDIHRGHCKLVSPHNYSHRQVKGWKSWRELHVFYMWKS